MMDGAGLGKTVPQACRRELGDQVMGIHDIEKPDIGKSVSKSGVTDTRRAKSVDGVRGVQRCSQGGQCSAQAVTGEIQRLLDTLKFGRDGVPDSQDQVRKAPMDASAGRPGTDRHVQVEGPVGESAGGPAEHQGTERRSVRGSRLHQCRLDIGMVEEPTLPQVGTAEIIVARGGGGHTFGVIPPVD